MKKSFIVFILLLLASVLVSIPSVTHAQACMQGSVCDESCGGSNGLVPCGRATNPDNSFVCACTFEHVGVLAMALFNFIVYFIAVPLAGLVITIAGILIMISGGPGGKNPVTGIISPNLYSTAKNMIWWALISILLMLSSWLIIHTVLLAIGVRSEYLI